jgi:release factor glutamine methyltransferase
VLDLYGSELAHRYGAGEARAIARMVFHDSFGWDILQLEDHREDALSESELLRVYGPLKRLSGGEPLQYVLGHAWFMGMTIGVAPGVLIPRPETEELVDHIARRDLRPTRIIDIGTGSGCIAIALKRIHPGAEVLGIDLSEEALDIARRNACALDVDVTWRRMDILAHDQELPVGLDLVVSNPPYVPRSEEASLDEHVRLHEPHLALFVEDADPLLFHRVIGGKAYRALVQGGELWLEAHHRHATAVGRVLVDLGFSQVEVMSDLSGSPRFIHAVR